MLKLYNSLTKKVEDFEPISPPKVGLYTCGPTVYDFDHIGHGRKYTYDDVLRRALTFNGFEVTHVQNITDVGHLVSDSDEGEDKLEKGSRKHGKTALEVADFFTKAHFEAMDKLNILRPSISCRATEHISEQIEMVAKLLDKGFAYETKEAIYFDVSKFPNYSKLFGQKLEDKKEGVREDVKTDDNKRNPQDFALWFFCVGRFADHQMHWTSPWGEGFPGWHIECSAMSVKYLGEQFDIHTGGEDHLPVHHPNEIAQSEASTGKSPFVRYWLHYAFLKVDGKKMSKSLDNFYTIDDIVEKGFDPLALRYLYLTAHYRDSLNFTWESLKASETALNKLRKYVGEIKTDMCGKIETEDFMEEFKSALNDDLNTSKALAVVWKVVKSDITPEAKYQLLMTFDEVLGLDLQRVGKVEKVEKVSREVEELINKREELRKGKKFAEADEVRKKIEEMGYEVKDGKEGVIVIKI